MQLEFLFRARNPQGPSKQLLKVGRRVLRLRFQRHGAARRYIMRVEMDGAVRLTIPRGGTLDRARSFAERNVEWIEKQLRKRATEALFPAEWRPGTEILFRGRKVPLAVRREEGPLALQFADQTVLVAKLNGNLREDVQRHLWQLATRELVPRTKSLAALHGLFVKRVTVRNQRSRWGSCSPKQTISLNWRLVQAPGWVRDYIILHELMHLREMNHSPRFWKLVAHVCPRYRTAEGWLKKHNNLLH